MTPLSGGHYALSSLVPTVAGCRVEVRLAGPDDSGWSEPVPSTAHPLPPRLCALGLRDVSGENLNVYHYFGSNAGHQRMVRLSWRTGEPVVEDGPS